MSAYEIVAANGETFGLFLDQFTYEELVAMAEQWDQDEPEYAPHTVVEVTR